MANVIYKRKGQSISRAKEENTFEGKGSQNISKHNDFVPVKAINMAEFYDVERLNQIKTEKKTVKEHVVECPI